MKEIRKRAVSILVVFCLFMCMMPTSVFAILGAEEKTATQGVKAGVENSVYYLENDYIRFDLEKSATKSGTLRMATQPTRTKTGISNAISKGMWQEIYFTVAGTNVKATTKSVNIVKDTEYTAEGDVEYYALEARYTFSKKRNYEAVVRYSLVRLDEGIDSGKSSEFGLGFAEDDKGRTWGVRVVASIGYESMPSGMYNSTDVVMWVNMHGFAKMGHINAQESAVIYMNTAAGSIDDGFTISSTALPGAIASTKTNVSTFARASSTSSEAITEIMTKGYSWANPFAATSGLYQEYVEGYKNYDDSFRGDGGGSRAGALPSEFSTTEDGDLLLRCDDFELMGAERWCYGTSALWGFRDLHSSNESDFTPNDNVTVAANAKHMGIYVKNGVCTPVAANNESELKSTNSTYGTLVAKIRGNYTEKNGRYCFTNGVAALSNTITAVWGSSTGELSIGKDGSITAKHIALNCPTFKFYGEKDGAADNALKMEFTEDGIEVTIDPRVNNAKIAIDIPNTSTEITSALINKDGGIKFGGSVEFEIFDGAGFDIEELSYGLKNGKFKINGIHATGEIDSTEMIGLEMFSVSGEIDTIKKYYHFELELNVFDMFETEAELELKRHTGTGAILPNKIWFYVGSEAVKIPLVPPIVLAHISGAGGGFDGLADTINGDFFAIPPLKLSIKGKGDALGVVEGSAKYTFGPAYYEYEASDIKFMKVANLIDEFSIYEGVQGATKTYKNVEYTGLNAIGGAYAKVSAPGGDWSFLEVSGKLDASAFGGLDSYKNPTKLYAFADINGQVTGKVKIPETIGVIGGMTLLKKTLDMYLGASTQMNVSDGFDKAVSSAFKNFKVYGGAKFESDWKLVKYRIWYIFPKNDLNAEVKGFWDDLSNWDWSERLTSVYSLENTDDGVVLLGLNMEEAEYSLTRASSTLPYSYDAVLNTTSGGGTLDADATVMMMITPKGTIADMESFAESIVITKDGDEVELTYPEYNSDNEITNDEEVNAIITKDGDGKDCIVVGLGENCAIGDEWNVSSEYADFDVSLNASMPFDTAEAELNGNELNVTVKHADDEAKYVVLTYLGTEKGKGEYLVGRTEVDDIDNITIEVPQSGADLPSGEYYLTVKVVREETVSVSDISTSSADDDITVYLPVDTIEFDSTVTYTNTMQPKAPTDVAIAPAGNEVMRAEWKESVGDADGYRVKVYKKTSEGAYEDTNQGYSYDTADIKAGKTDGISYDSETGMYTLDMALTVGGTDLEADENKNTTTTNESSVLLANEEYLITVSSYNYMKDGENEPIANSQIYSEEVKSNSSLLPEYKAVKIEKISVTDVVPGIKSEAVLDSETGIWTVAASASPYYSPSMNIGELWRITVDTEDEEEVQCKITTDDGVVLEERDYGYYCYELNHRNVEGNVMLKIEIKEDKGTYTDVTTQYLIIEKDNIAPVLSTDRDIVYADKETGKYKIEGVSEAGATVYVGGVNPANITVDENGRFTYEDNAFEMKEHRYDYEEGGYVYDDEGNPVYDIVTNTEPGGVISLYSVDAAGNKSENVIVILTVDDDPYEEEAGTGSSGHGNGGGGGGITSYTVKFETNGGSSVANSSVTKNSTLSAPATPTREGYEFAGWYEDKELSTLYDFNKKVTSSFTLYAGWNEIVEDGWKNPFNDVSERDWYYEFVKYVNENGLMSGTSSDEFSPNDNLTRAMLVTILYRAEGEPEADNYVPFKDIVSGSYYENAVRWAQFNALVNGYSEDEFAPDDFITREQIAAILYRYAKYKGYDVSVGEDTNILSYTDFNEISEYAVSVMQYAVGSGLMKGKTAVTLNPKDNATRAEFATILKRFDEIYK